MQCPACGHEGTAPALRCSSCGNTFPRKALEEYDRLNFLLSELSVWARDGLITESQLQQFARRYETDLQELEDLLGVRAPAVPAAAPSLAPPLPVPPAAVPAEAEVREEAPPLAAARAAPPAPPPPPPPIPRPRISWEDLWRALLSERSLEALLYVGAFLIVAAAGTFVAFNWGRFAPTLQLLFLAAGTASFYLIGWLLRGRWRLPRSSGTFIGIGALIIPVDFFAWARFRDLPPASYPLIWLAASATCAAMYAATAWWLRQRFFLIITLIAAHSLVLSLLQVLAVPAAWWGAATILVASVWVLLEPPLERADAQLARAAFFTALVAVVAGLAAPIWISRHDWAGLFSTVAPAGFWILPVAAAAWAAVPWSALAGRRHHPIEFGNASAVSAAVAAILTLLPLMTRPWVSLGLLALAFVYVAGSDRLARQDRFTEALQRALRETGVGLSALALAWSLLDWTSAAVVFGGAAVLYTGWAYRFRQPLLLLGAQAALLLGAIAALVAWHVAPRLWAPAILAVAVSGLAAARLSRRAPLFALHWYLGAFAEVGLALAVGLLWEGFPRVSVLVTGGALMIAIYAAVLAHRALDDALGTLIETLARKRGRRAPIFQWIAAILGIVELVLVWLWWRPVPHGLPWAGLLLASVYILTGRRVGRMEKAYRDPWMSVAAIVAVLSTVLAVGLGNRQEIAGTLFLAAATAALWAWLLEAPALTHVAAWLVIPAFVLELPAAMARGLLPSREAFAWGFATLGIVYLAIGGTLDRVATRFSTGFHLVSHLLIPFALLWALQEEDVGRWTLAAAIVFYALSARLMHAGRHPSASRFVERLTARIGEGASGPLRAVFVYAAAWLFPFWFHLTLHHVPLIGYLHPRFGVAAALLAWAYLGAGQVLGSWNANYRLPLQIAAEALAVVGGLLAADARPMLILAVAIGVGLQLAFHRLTRHVLWVYTGALGGATLVGLVLAHLDVPGAQAGWAMIGLAGAYLATAEVPLRRATTGTTPPAVPPPAASLYAVSFLITAIGVLLAALAGAQNAAVGFLLGAVVFLWAGGRLRDPLLGYPVAGLLAAAYVAALVVIFRLRGTPEPAYGIWLAPGIAAFLAAGPLLERGAARTKPVTSHRSAAALLGRSWAGPAYLAAHVGTLAMIVHSAAEPSIFPLALILGAVVYGLSTLSFRSPLWLYPALLATHLALFFELLRIPLDPRFIPAAFVPLTAALALIGRRAETVGGGGPLRDLPWAQPWYTLALADLLLWELVGVIDARTGVLTSLGFAAVAAPFVAVWRDRRAASLTLILLTAAFGELLRWLGAPYHLILLGISLYALGLGVLAVALRRSGRGTLWQAAARPLASVLSAGALAVAVAGVPLALDPKAGEGLVYTLSVVGLFYLLLSVEERTEWLGYLGVGMLEAAWAIFLLKRLEVRELQAYAIPAGIYLLAVAAVERGKGRRAFAQVVDLAGLALLFGSALLQSLGPDGFPYAVLLAVESLLIAWSGALQRLRRHFFGGLGVLVLDVIIQAVDPLLSLNKTVLFLSLGAVLVATAVLAERNRERIMRTTREWRTRLEAWE